MFRDCIWWGLVKYYNFFVNNLVILREILIIWWKFYHFKRNLCFFFSKMLSFLAKYLLFSVKFSVFGWLFVICLDFRSFCLDFANFGGELVCVFFIVGKICCYFLWFFWFLFEISLFAWTFVILLELCQFWWEICHFA